jgi:chromate transporter
MEGHGHLPRWLIYLLAGVMGAILIGPYLVLVLLGCGLFELVRRGWFSGASAFSWKPGALTAAASSGGVGALAWTALKVGALSFGGGFVIVPLMQDDAVHVYHWMTNAQFLNAVALGQVTPGPVVATVAAVGYAAHGIGGGLLAAAVAFAPSFSFILLGGGRFERLRGNERARGFLDGAGPAAIGAILGSAVTLAGGIDETWQIAVLAAAAVTLLIARRGVVETLVASGGVGAALALLGAPLP